MKKSTGKCPIDSTFVNPHRSGIPSHTEAPGEYDKHPALGPGSVNGGFPLKFIDTSIKAEAPTKASMDATPASQSKS